ncbi:MAG: hypothetical protein ABIR35_11325 [Polaromonas sp.]
MTTHKPLTVRVCGPLRSRINALAHSLAGQEEKRIRAALIAQVQAAADDGAKLPELHSIVDRLEAGGA